MNTKLYCLVVVMDSFAFTPLPLLVSYLLLVLIAFLAVDLLARWRRRHRQLNAGRFAELTRDQQPLMVLYPRIVGKMCLGRLVHPGQLPPRWRRCALVVTPARFTAYAPALHHEIFTFTPDELQWVAVPDEVDRYYTTFWLHIERNREWFVLELRLYKNVNSLLMRAVKQFADSAEVGAERWRRRDLHYGPVRAEPAAQDIHGEWVLDEPVSLYLMPRFLVVLREGIVLRKIPLAVVQEITALRRLDEPSASGLVRFRAEEETLAFALDHYEDFAHILAEATHHHLEEALAQKQKKSDDWDERDDESPRPLALT
ncbi:MAG TPA: hypothetical protein VHO69_17155 [Phototrophicaceae bacterium]|nr:hypothetical protein [Phototrophicaceae bacterium]